MTERAQQVDGHVVARRERRHQRVRARRGEPRDPLRVHRGCPLHDGIALRVDAASARTARHLRVLPGREVDVRLAVVLDQLLQDHGARGHVDAQRQRLGGEDDLDQAAIEELFDDVAESREHPRVVCGESADHRSAPAPEAEHFEVLGRDVGDPGVDDGGDLLLLGHVGEFHAGGAELLQRALATGAGEDEHDRGQHRARAEQLDHVTAARRPPLLRFLPLVPLVAGEFPAAEVVAAAGVVGAAAAARSAAATESAIAGTAAPAAPAPAAVVITGFGAGGGVEQVAVDLGAAGLEQRVQALADEHVLAQRHRAVVGNHDFGVAAHGGQPVAEFLGVGHRRRQADELHGLVQVEDDLLPHRPALAVGEVVDFVHDHVAQAVQRRRLCVEHVAQHLGGHDDDVGVAVARHVAGEQADLFLAVHGDEVVVLLVAQRLDGRRVEALAAVGEGRADGEFADDGLAGAGGRAHQNSAPGFDGAAGAELEIIGGEAQVGDEVVQEGHVLQGVTAPPPAPPRWPAPAATRRCGRRLPGTRPRAIPCP